MKQVTRARKTKFWKILDLGRNLLDLFDMIVGFLWNFGGMKKLLLVKRIKYAHFTAFFSSFWQNISDNIMISSKTEHCMESFSADLFSIYSAIVKILILGKGTGTMFLFHALCTFAWNVQV